MQLASLAIGYSQYGSITQEELWNRVSQLIQGNTTIPDTPVDIPSLSEPDTEQTNTEIDTMEPTRTDYAVHLSEKLKERGYGIINKPTAYVIYKDDKFLGYLEKLTLPSKSYGKQNYPSYFTTRKYNKKNELKWDTKWSDKRQYNVQHYVSLIRSLEWDGTSGRHNIAHYIDVFKKPEKIFKYLESFTNHDY